jgi:phosphoribosylanthranilate isomerase
MDLKICGITHKNELDILHQEGARYAGLWTGIDGHPRNLSDARFAELADHCRRVTPVAVCVKRPVRTLWAMLQHTDIRHVQLHGFNVPSDIAYLRAQGCTVIKTLHVTDNGDCPGERLIEPCIDAGCDVFLIDRFGGRRSIGSSGVSLDPTVVQRWQSRLQGHRVWLAGGLTADRINDLAEHSAIETVDVDSAARRDGGAIDRKAARMLVLASAPSSQIQAA